MDDPDESLMDGVGDALRAARRKYRVSQRELAGLLGVDRAVVGRWESGDGPVAAVRLEGVLRLLGFRLAVVPRDPSEWVGIEDPGPHLSDRSERRYPAHLRGYDGGGSTGFNDWVRYRGEPNPYAPGWTYRMDPERRREMAAKLARRSGPPED